MLFKRKVECSVLTMFKKYCKIILAVLIIPICFSYANDLSCPDFEEISLLEPEYVHMELEPGDDFNMTCCLRNHSYCLKIDEKNNFKIPDLQEVNASVKQVTIRDVEYKKHGYEFTCKCGNRGFKVIRVSVGTAPQKVKKLVCTVIDFLRMECIVELNYESIKTHYSIFLNESKIPATQIEFGDDPKYSFTLTEPKYKMTQRIYDFTLISSNSIGSHKEQKFVDQYYIVKPQIQGLKFANITSDSVSIMWNITNLKSYTKYTNGLVYNLSLQSKKFNFFKKDFELQMQDNQVWVDISNLYPFGNYTVELRVRANLTGKIDKRLWSDKIEETFSTLPRIPQNPPEIDVGNFYMHPNGKVISLYWKQIPEYEHNGPNFTYQIEQTRENGQKINAPFTIDTNSAIVKLEWKNTSEYEFDLKSRNQEGVSLKTSVLKITPRYTNITKHRDRIWSTANLYNHTYSVSWLKPINFTVLSSFTIFWCNGNIESHNQCTGPMNYENLDRNSLNYTTAISTTTNFALAENYYNNTYSSGLMWIKCSKNVENDNFEVTLEEGIISTENSITIHWHKECWHSTVFDGYIVKYCLENSNSCENVTISNANVNKFTITELQSYSSYKIFIQPILKNGLGKISNPIFGRTGIETDVAKISIIVCSLIFGTLALIALTYYLKNQIIKMKKIKLDLPEIYENGIKYTRNDEKSADYTSERKNVCEEKVPWDITMHEVSLDCCSNPEQEQPEETFNNYKDLTKTDSNLENTHARQQLLPHLSQKYLPSSELVGYTFLSEINDKSQNNQEEEQEFHPSDKEHEETQQLQDSNTLNGYKILKPIHVTSQKYVQPEELRISASDNEILSTQKIDKIMNSKSSSLEYVEPDQIKQSNTFSDYTTTPSTDNESQNIQERELLLRLVLQTHQYVEPQKSQRFNTNSGHNCLTGIKDEFQKVQKVNAISHNYVQPDNLLRQPSDLCHSNQKGKDGLHPNFEGYIQMNLHRNPIKNTNQKNKKTDFDNLKTVKSTEKLGSAFKRETLVNGYIQVKNAKKTDDQTKCDQEELPFLPSSTSGYI